MIEISLGHAIMWGIFIFALGGALSEVFRRTTTKTKTKTGDSDFQETQAIIGQIRSTIQDQVLNHHVKLFNGIAKQKMVLNDQGRTSIAIFISPDMFKDLIAVATSDDQAETLYEIMLGLRTPVGFLGDLPIYISELLTDAPVFVVGGIRWEL